MSFCKLKSLYLILMGILFTGISLQYSLAASQDSKIIRLNYSSAEELEKDLKPIVPQVLITPIFDEIENTTFVLQLVNDYDFKDPNEEPVLEKNDDIGFTHGYRIEIKKNLAPQGFDNYYLTISYESQLHTNSDTPEEFNNDYRDVIYLNDRGFWQADVFFKEQNLLEVVTGKIKAQDALYWKAGVGFIEINADDSDRPFLFSSIEHQRWLHESVNDIKGATIREYNYLSNEDASKRGVYLTAEAGRDYSLYMGDENRVFLRPSIRTRISSIKDSSYVGANIEIGNDFTPPEEFTFLPALRVSANMDIEKYTDGSTYRSYGFRVSAKYKYFTTTLKHTVPLDNEPGYLNPLPNDFFNRDSLQPRKDATTWLILEGHLP